MPDLPPNYVGKMEVFGSRETQIMPVVKHTSYLLRPGFEISTTATSTELRIHGSDEVLEIPVVVSTTVLDVKQMLQDKLGLSDPGQLTFVAKQGCYWREQKDHEEIRRKVTIKGIKSFERPRMQHPHPIAVIGAGHIGLRQAMIFMKHKEFNFVIFDRRPKVGGSAWWEQANKTAKLQTENGVYHLG